MIRVGLLVLALLVTACGDRTPALAGASPSPSVRYTPEPTTPASPSPRHLPGTSVSISVNGTAVAPGTTGTLADAGPSIVTLRFPVDMDRASVERWVTQPGTVAWTDDRTLTLTIPESAATYGFKIPQAVSKDGGTIIELFVVNLDHGPSVVVSIFTVAELLGGAQAPKTGAPRVTGGKGIGIYPSPDGAKVLSFSAYAPPGAPPTVVARVVDLSTRASAAIAVPTTSAALSVAGWSGNDRIVFAGDHVWLSPVGAATARDIADLAALGTLRSAEVSPNGGYVAVASTERLAVVDLATGVVRTLAGHRDDCQPALGPVGGRVAWSKDERRIVVVECAASSPAVSRTRVIDVAADRTVAVVDGGDYAGIATLLTGEFAVSRPPDRTGAGAPTLWVVFAFDGVERTRFLSRGPALSPDGRYNIEPGCCAGEGFALRDLADPSQPGRGTPGSAQWLRDGRVLVLTR